MKKFLFCIFAALAALTACQERYTEHWELALDRDTVSVSASEVSLPFTIYASGSWKASLTDGSGWASLDKSGGEGVTTIHVLFEPNAGLRRTATLEVSAAGLTKKALIIQRAGIRLPQVKFSEHSVTKPSGAFLRSIYVDTNIPEEYFGGVTPSLEGSDPELLSAVQLSSISGDSPEDCGIPGAVRRELSFRINAPASAEERYARIRLTVTGSGDESYGDTLAVFQSAEPMSITLPSETIVETAGGSKTVAFSSNLGDDAPGVEASISYPSGTPAFISSATVADGSVVLEVEDNSANSTKRYATLSLSYTDADGSVTTASSEIRQNAEVKDFKSFTITDLDDLLLWNSSVSLWSAEDCIYLGADIDLDGHSWNVNDFAGTFDGQGHGISGFSAQAVFGKVSGSVKHVTIGGELTVSDYTTTDAGKKIASVAPVLKLAGSGELSGITNNAIVSATAAGTDSLYIGGICAFAEAAGSISGCTNNGEVKVSSTTNRLYEGGILGYTKTSKLSISGCTNTAEVSFSAKSSNFSFLGGIVGCTNIGFEEFSDCTNSGSVIAGGGSTYNYLGGIVGNATGGTASISLCTNSGSICNKGANTKADGTRMGGIVGASNPGSGVILEISGCHNTGNLSNEAALSVSHDLGGLCGYPSGGSLRLENSTSVAEISSAGSSAKLGAFVGYLSYNNVTALSCGAGGKVGGTELTADNFSSYLGTPASTQTIKTEESKPNYFIGQ